MSPISPAEILLNEFMKPLKLDIKSLSELVFVDRRKLFDVIENNFEIDADLAIRFARLFGNDAMFWLNLQSNYNLRIRKMSIDITELNKINLITGQIPIIKK